MSHPYENGCACAACARYAEALTLLVPTPASEATLPAGLRGRLLALAAPAEDGGRARYLYERALTDGAADLEGERGRPAPIDLEPAERPLYRALRATVADERRPQLLPAELGRRLLATGGPRPLPWWVRDGRYAAVACLVLTLVSTVLVGDAAAALSQRPDTREHRREWLAVGRELGFSFVDDLESFAVECWQRGRQILDRRGEEALDLFSARLHTFRKTEVGRRLVGPPLTPQGAHDDPAQP
jgi:hypothetical protein